MPNEPDRRMKVKIKVDRMTEIIEATIKEFNAGQRMNRSIAHTFKVAGQDPRDDSDDCKAMFKEHLDSLAKLPMYKLMEREIENQTGVSVQGGGVEGREAE